MLNENIVILGFIIQAFGALKYVIETIKGQVKPNKVTFFLWTLAPLIAFSAEIQQGVGIQSLLTFSVGFFPLIIFCSSFINKKSSWKLRKFDLICGVLSVTGLILWYLTKIGNIAIIFAILADGLAALPTAIKAYHYPETENIWLYLTGVANALLTILAINNWSFANYGFPFYILFLDLSVFLIVKRKFILNKLNQSSAF